MILLLRTLQITLILMQKCQSEYNNFNYRNNVGNSARQAKNNYVILKPHARLRGRDNNQCHSDHDDETTEECLCACNECDNYKPCCAEFCQNCQTRNSVTTPQQFYPSPAQSDVVVVPYPVPILIFPIKKAKQATEISIDDDTVNTKPQGRTTTISFQDNKEESQTPLLDTTKVYIESVQEEIDKEEALAPPEDITTPMEETFSVTEETESPEGMSTISETVPIFTSPDEEEQFNTEEANPVFETTTEVALSGKEGQSDDEESTPLSTDTTTKSLNEQDQSNENTVDPNLPADSHEIASTDPTPSPIQNYSPERRATFTKFKLPYRIPSWLRRFA